MANRLKKIVSLLKTDSKNQQSMLSTLAIKLIEQKAFDSEWYLANYPEVKRSKQFALQPVSHFLSIGGTRGFNPAPWFNSGYYLSTYADVKNAGVNPLIHYIQHGVKEGRRPANHLLFSAQLPEYQFIRLSEHGVSFQVPLFADAKCFTVSLLYHQYQTPTIGKPCGVMLINCFDAHGSKILYDVIGATWSSDLECWQKSLVQNDTERLEADIFQLQFPEQAVYFQFTIKPVENSALELRNRFTLNLTRRPTHSAMPSPVAGSKTNELPRSKLKAIAIMDEISEECWRFEMESFPINRQTYQQQVATSSADFCFLESCWKGNRGTWQYAFTSPGLKHENARALLDLIPRVKEKMPLVFWNKEDPMHYDRYLPIAKFADIIFTTDALKVSEYQRDVPDAKVYAVPFAAQQQICNPSGRFKTEPETVCFAGSYYGVGHDERKRQMDALLPAIIDFNGSIYDRMSNEKNDRYKFPEQYNPFIRDAVPFTEVVTLYKKFKVFLNVNTIVDSPTMMSRRVYELLACGTPVVSTPSKAIEEQFGGVVHVAQNAEEAHNIINKLLTDEHFWEKISHLGYREVMTKHTYTHRLRNIQQALGHEINDSTPLVSIITCTCRPNMIDRIVDNMTRQSHPECELILVLQNFNDSQKTELITKLEAQPCSLKRIEIVVNDNSEITLGERFNQAASLARGEYIAKMDDDDFYFEHYLSDMLIPFTFGDYGLVGKKELYMFLSGSNKLIKRFGGMKHQEVDFVAGATFVFKAAIFHKYKFKALNRGEDSDLINRLKVDGIKIYAADPFNFIVWRGDTVAHTWDASDEYFLKGAQSEVVSDLFDISRVSF